MCLQCFSFIRLSSFEDVGVVDLRGNQTPEPNTRSTQFAMAMDSRLQSTDMTV